MNVFAATAPEFLADSFDDVGFFADAFALDPEIAALCEGTPVAPVNACAATLCLINLLYTGCTAVAYGLGWSPSAVNGWLAFVEAEFAAAQRRATKQSKNQQRRVRHFAIAAGVRKAPRRGPTVAQQVVIENRKWGLVG